MTVWHLPYAILGRLLDMTKGGSLTFDPKLTETIWTMPVYSPGLLGTISKTGPSKYSFMLKLGNTMTLAHLAVGSTVHPWPATLVAGQSVS